MACFEIDLQEFHLGDVLEFLTRVKKTGVLRVVGNIGGEIFLKHGLVVHATDGSQQGMEALINLSFIKAEKGVFDVGIEPPQQTISEEVGKLREGIEKRRIEFQKIKDNLPPMDAVLTKSTKELESAVALRRTDWQILALVDGKRSLAEVIAESKIGGYEATKTIAWLKEKGLIYDPKEAERVMAKVIHYLENFFKVFKKNGLNWLRRWSEVDEKNRKLFDTLQIDEENLEVKVGAKVEPEIIDHFFKDFDTFIKKEGQKLYGKLLFKKKYEEFNNNLHQEE